jgi:hypothetical protein
MTAPESDSSYVERQKVRLAEASRRHLEYKARVDYLQARVNATSADLADAKKWKLHYKTEIDRVEQLLRNCGLSTDEIATIGHDIEVMAA